MGNDNLGKEFIEILKKDDINIDNVTFSTEAPTSVASILVDKTGANYCVVNYGATLDLSEVDLDNAEETIKNSNILITTMMVPEKTALYALKLAKNNNCIKIFQ